MEGVMFNWLSSELIWFSCGVVLIFLEFAVPGVILVFFGAGAILTSLLVWIGEFGKLARTNNTMIIPKDFADVSGTVAALTMVMKNS